MKTGQRAWNPDAGQKGRAAWLALAVWLLLAACAHAQAPEGSEIASAPAETEPRSASWTTEGAHPDYPATGSPDALSRGAGLQSWLPDSGPAGTTETPGQDGPTFSQWHSGLSGYKFGRYDPQAGFVVVEPDDPRTTPFEMNLRVIGQGRYTGFARSQPTWTQTTGQVTPIQNVSTIQLDRLWLSASGYAFDPRLVYSFIVFTSTASSSATFLGWGGYQLDPRLNVYVGYWKVPATREWLTPFFFVFGTERTMATTFFRPSFSPGVWANGVLARSFHYYLFLGSSFGGTTAEIVQNRLNNNMVYSANLWWEPLGDYGPTLDDLQHHPHLVIRTGSSFTYQREIRDPSDISNIGGPGNNPAATVFRLSNGTPLNAVGALGPGVLLNAATVHLLTFDQAFKYRGFTVYNEYLLRWLDNPRATGGTPVVNALFDWGGILQGGYFLLPRTLELYSRSSFVRGHFGTGWEAGGGVAWYPKRNANLKCTLEALRITRCPAQNLLTPYLGGESGTAVLAQFQFVF